MSDRILVMPLYPQYAAATTATGAIRSAALIPHMSEQKPRMVGETASPKAWIKKILTAKAVARREGMVTLTITVSPETEAPPQGLSLSGLRQIISPLPADRHMIERSPTISLSMHTRSLVHYAAEAQDESHTSDAPVF